MPVTPSAAAAPTPSAARRPPRDHGPANGWGHRIGDYPSLSPLLHVRFRGVDPREHRQPMEAGPRALSGQLLNLARPVLNRRIVMTWPYLPGMIGGMWRRGDQRDR